MNPRTCPFYKKIPGKGLTVSWLDVCVVSCDFVVVIEKLMKERMPSCALIENVIFCWSK